MKHAQQELQNTYLIFETIPAAFSKFHSGLWVGLSSQDLLLRSKMLEMSGKTESIGPLGREFCPERPWWCLSTKAQLLHRRSWRAHSAIFDTFQSWGAPLSGRARFKSSNPCAGAPLSR